MPDIACTLDFRPLGRLSMPFFCPRRLTTTGWIETTSPWASPNRSRAILSQVVEDVRAVNGRQPVTFHGYFATSLLPLAYFFWLGTLRRP